MVNPLAPILQRHPIILLDGALATELERRGCDLRDPLWSAKALLETPDLIRQVHLDYFLAGADGAITASYQATVTGFMRRGLNATEAMALIQRSVRLAIEARDAFWADPANHADRPRPFVAASVGPYGAFLADGSEYRGDYGLSEAALIEFHRPRLAALLAAGADILACETLPCRVEAQALVHLLAEFPDASAWISFSARDGAHTCHGERLADCAAWLDACPQVAAVGVNCTAPRYIPDLVRAIRSATQKPIVVYPNSGEVYDAARRNWRGSGLCATFAEQAREWYACGARIIGGCCRTTPDHIRALAAWARHLPPPAAPVIEAK
ncbi:MAG: homocysteine S-methyltransferase [Candidatus Competibacter sp.]|nr:homocysteine S-methyltransferase [Candidatus Competibacter sp.]MDG4606290.1 homocysteine S-methyltransferase [Candidatus Contendobacter sp.]HRD50673.1 homocysteine S-methyltransferase [Candidatus Contendobacter sp.]